MGSEIFLKFFFIDIQSLGNNSKLHCPAFSTPGSISSYNSAVYVIHQYPNDK